MRPYTYEDIPSTRRVDIFAPNIISAETDLMDQLVDFMTNVDYQMSCSSPNPDTTDSSIGQKKSLNTWRQKETTEWNSDDVLDWLFHTATTNWMDCSILHAESFQSLTGDALCNMKQEEFIALDPNYGHELWHLFHDLTNRASINSSTSICVSENFNHSLEHVNMHDSPSDSTISPITYTHAQRATYPDYNLPARYVEYDSLNDVPTHSSNVLPTFYHSFSQPCDSLHNPSVSAPIWNAEKTAANIESCYSPVTAYSHSTGQSLQNSFKPMENFQNSTLTGDTLCSPFTTYRRGTSFVLQHSISVTSVDSPLSSPSSFESIVSSPEADLNAYPLSTCDHSSTEDKIFEDISQMRFLPTTSVDSIGVKKEESAEPVCAQIPIDFVTAQFTRELCDPGDCTVSRSRPKSESNKSKRRRKRNNSVDSKEETILKGKQIQLWEFLYKTLRNPDYNPRYIRWENESKGSFRFVKSDAVAKLWGYTKFNPFMTYEKLSRAMRHYYKRGIIKRLDDRRLVYRFTPHRLELLSAIYPSTALSLTVARDGTDENLTK